MFTDYTERVMCASERIGSFSARAFLEDKEVAMAFTNELEQEFTGMYGTVVEYRAGLAITGAAATEVPTEKNLLRYQSEGRGPFLGFLISTEIIFDDNLLCYGDKADLYIKIEDNSSLCDPPSTVWVPSNHLYDLIFYKIKQERLN